MTDEEILELAAMPRKVNLEKMLADAWAKSEDTLKECRNQYTGLSHMYEDVQKERDDLQKRLHALSLDWQQQHIKCTGFQSMAFKQAHTIAAQQVRIEKYREALEFECGNRCNAEYNPCNARTVLATTDDLTILKEHDNELIEKCLTVILTYVDLYKIAREIRSLKT